MKPHTLFDVDAWVNRQFKPAPKPIMPVVDMARAIAPKSKRGEKVAKKPRPFLTVEHRAAWRGCSPAVRKIIRTVSKVSGVPVGEIIGRRVIAEHAEARQVAVWLARNFTDRSLPAIGSEFRRDHTTVLYAVRKIDASIRERSIEPDKHTVEGWAHALLDWKIKERARRSIEYAKRQRAILNARRAKARAEKQASK